MTLEYNSKTYEVTGESVYSDFSVIATSLEEACSIVTELQGISSYTFSKTKYKGMAVKRMCINIDDGGYSVRVILRHQTKTEQLETELTDLRSAVADIADAIPDDVAAKHPVLFPTMDDFSDTIAAGTRFVKDGVVYKADNEIPVDTPIKKLTALAKEVI